MTRGKKFGIGIGGVLAVLVIGVVLFALLFDWNRLRPTINSKVSAAIDRPFAINGDLDLHWGAPPGAIGLAAWIPSPHLVAHDITLGNPKTIDDAPRMAHLARVDAWLAPLGLLSHSVHLPRIALVRPDATLIRHADGDNNWTFDLGGSSDDASTQPSAWEVEVDQIYLDKATVTLKDAVSDADITLAVKPLGDAIAFEQIAGKRTADDSDLAQSAGQPGDFVFGWTIDGRYKDEPLTGSGKLGGMLSMESAAHPFPVQADVRSGGTRVQVAGSIIKPMNFGGAELDVKFSGPSLDRLHRLTGITLPATPSYETDGHVSARFQGDDGARFAYKDFNGRIGESDIHGSLTYTLDDPRPSLTGAVISNQLRFADLSPLIGADSSKHQEQRGVASKQPPGKVLPVEPFKTEQWKTMDADVKFTARRIVPAKTDSQGDDNNDKQKSLPFSDIYAHVVLEDGDILIDPLRFGVADGNLNTTLRLEGSRSPMAVRMDLHARGLELDKILPKVEALDSSLGQINGDATLSGTGNSVAAIMGDANGRVTVLIDQGQISRNLMELAGLNVGNYLVGKLFGDKPTAINCAAADIRISNGVAKPNVFVFDTKDAVINITGDTHFKTEQLDFTITPKSKGIRLLTLRTPLVVNGTYADPSPGVKPGPLIARGAAAVILGVVGTPAASLLALISPTKAKANQCGPVIARIKKSGADDE